MMKGNGEGDAAAATVEMSNRLPEAAATESRSESEAQGDESKIELAEQVVGNPSLANVIFGYAIWDDYEDPDFRRENLCSYRLICKCWKHAVSKLLEKKQEPLYVVQMTQDNSLTGAPEVQESGKILDKFVDFLNSREDPDSYAGFCLQMEREVFRLENYDHLLAFLGQCGQHLVEMQLKIPKNGGSFPGQFPNTLELASLQKLRLEFDTTELDNLSDAEKLPNPAANVILMVQALLQQGNTLKELQFVGEWIPPELQYAKLPPSLVTLGVQPFRNPRLLECLTRNQLPELKELSLHVTGDNQFPEQSLIFRVFEKLRQSLRALNIFKSATEERAFKLRFPVMEELRILFLACGKFELETEMPSHFPRLTSMVLIGVNGNILHQSISPIASVTKLQFISQDGTTLEFMKDVHRTLPNLTDLSVLLKAENLEDLQYVFREMRQLKRLSILAWNQEVSPDHWDSLLMGAPLEFVKGMKMCDFWKSIELDIKNGDSIKMLKELTYLQLGTFGYNPRVRNGALITDLPFIYALNGMSKLEHVKLKGRFSFQVSKEIVEEWKEQGRRIECIPE